MQDPASELPENSVNAKFARILLLRRWVNKGIKEGPIGQRSSPRVIPAALGGGPRSVSNSSGAGDQVWVEGMV